MRLRLLCSLEVQAEMLCLLSLLGKVLHLPLWLLLRPVRKGIIVRDLLTPQSKPL